MDYIKTVSDFWKPQLVSGTLFLYFFYLLFGCAIGLMIYQLIRWFLYNEKPYWMIGEKSNEEKELAKKE